MKRLPPWCYALTRRGRRVPSEFGRYTLIANLAQGGMGALYLACQGEHGIEKLCVIKTVLPGLADGEYVARFRDEAKVVVKLSHGNLVPVFDAGMAGGSAASSCTWRWSTSTARTCAPCGTAAPRRGSPFPSTSRCTSPRTCAAASGTRTRSRR